MTCDVITDKKVWESFVVAHGGNFLHSWQWGEFNTSLGHTTIRCGLYDKSRLVLVCLVLIIKAKRGTFLFVPHGPLVDTATHDFASTFTLFLTELIQVAKKNHCSFIRISPLLEKNETNMRIFPASGFRPAPMHMHSELCWVLDIRPPEDILLSNMRKTTRYLVRQMQKYNIVVTSSSALSDFDSFYRVYTYTQKRQHFVGFGRDYLHKEIEVFLREKQGFLYFARVNEKVLSVAFVVVYGNHAYYHHGASILDDKNTPAAYVIQWEIIKDLKKKGISHYNFWGIAPENNKKHPWYGLTFFKKGFGGESVEYIHACDLPLTSFYYINWVIETVRKFKRGY